MDKKDNELQTLIEEFKNCSPEEQQKIIKDLYTVGSALQQEVTYLANLNGYEYSSEIQSKSKEAEGVFEQIKMLEAIANEKGFGKPPM